MDGFAITGDEVVPVGQRLSLVAEAIGARRGQPFDPADVARVQADAFRDIGVAVLVVGTASGLAVEQAAGDVGRVELARLLVLQLVQAAFAASVAQRFPLRAVER